MDTVPPKAARRTSAGPQRSHATHQAILAAAEALLNERGPAGVTFEAVARLANAGKPTVYRWWPNKTALLLELYDQHKDRVVGAPDRGTFRADLIELIDTLWTFWRETSGGPALAAVIAEAQSDPESRKSLLAHFSDDRRARGNPLNLVIDRAIARGELAATTPIAAIREPIMAANWFCLLCGRLEPDRIQQLVDQLLDGLLARDC